LEGMIRYREQSDTVEVPLAAPYDPHQIAMTFKSIHQRLYGFATDEPWELDTLRVTVSAPSGHRLKPQPARRAEPGAKIARSAKCWFAGHGAMTTAFYDRDALAVEARVAGPAVIEDPWSTVVIPPAAVAWVDGLQNLQIETRETAS